jgi:8-oxo-dGTP diphosphatase
MPETHLKAAFGGVIFDDEGKVLLREPSGHFDNYVWTFAKGRPNPGETPEEAALREVREETGVTARIICEIPGAFDGGTTRNRYFLMSPVDQVAGPLHETASVRWVTLEEARTLIGLTRNVAGRQRDLAVLEAAVRAWRIASAV